MERDELFQMARDAGLAHWDDMVQADAFSFALPKRLERFAALVAAREREILRRDGWRKCAAGQRTTQFCAMVEEAVKAEREAAAKECETLLPSKRIFDQRYYEAVEDCVATIRARGEK